MSETSGYLSLVLHAHLPFVRHPEYDKFLEEHWFFEAITDTYIPVIRSMDAMIKDGTKFKLTISVSPTLCAMMEDELLQERYSNHLQSLIKLASSEVERTQDWHDMHELAKMYLHRFTEILDIFENRCNRKIASALKELSETGCLELMTCTATHGFLPVLKSVESSVRAQVFAGVKEHTRVFGKPPAGMWVPECAYYPGLDEILKEAGVRYFMVESHAISHADVRPVSGTYAPVYCPSGVAAFGRDDASGRLVWSDKVGYPGNVSYREFYRDVGFDLKDEEVKDCMSAPYVRHDTGIKYFRITGEGEHKELYDPHNAWVVATEQAQDFVQRVQGAVDGARHYCPAPPMVVAPFDAELFGHWWYEGPMWVELVLRKLVHDFPNLEPMTPGEYLDKHPVQQCATPAPSTWGHKGYNEYWVNETNDWAWPLLHEAGMQMEKLADEFQSEKAGTLKHRALVQAGRELLLAQGSDWPFILTTNTTTEYATRRINDHLARFNYLVSALYSDDIEEEKLAALEYLDEFLPTLNPAFFSAKYSPTEASK